MAEYTLNPDAMPILREWLNDPDGELSGLKTQARLWIESLEAENAKLKEENNGLIIDRGEVCELLEGFGRDDETVAQAVFRLTAIVDKLPETRDGLRVVPYVDTVFIYDPVTGLIVEARFWDYDRDHWGVQERFDYRVGFWNVAETYSSRAAAEAAKEKADG